MRSGHNKPVLPEQDGRRPSSPGDLPAAAHIPVAPIAILAVAGFLLVTTEFVIIGLIPALARDFGVTPSQAGLLVSLFAFTVTFCGPVLTARLAGRERKRLFTIILLIFAGANLMAAISPNVWILAVARFIPALALPVFWGTASETAAQLAGPRHAGRAVGRVYLGISAALVLGVPLGTVIGNAIGWRGAFAVLAGLTLLAALLMHVCMPRPPMVPVASRSGQLSLLKSSRFLMHVLLSVLVFTAMFTSYTFLAELLEGVAEIAPSWVGWWMMGFGIVGLLGNWLGGVMADRNSLGATVGFLFLLAVVMVILVPVASNHWPLSAVLAFWGIAYTALFPICQIRVMQHGQQAQALAGTLNVSAANAGTGLGAVVGGWVISELGTAFLGYASAALAVVAVLCALPLFRQSNQ
ncbi:MFS transporter [Sodalis sp. RH24]|uniref:MFS transporter n=1 Tax=unclassified Sodalis (in: enterobacteria) TaxID=2636512 RepID=UPI0039B570E8